MSPLYAHTPPTGSKSFHLLSDHLAGVQRAAGSFAEKFCAKEIGGLLGLTHDLGKASPAFQRYLVDCFEATPSPRRAPHSDPGAAAVSDLLGAFTLCVLGHHAGMPALGSVKQRCLQADPAASDAARRLAEALDLARPPTHAAMRTGREGEHLIRMCFSALVDADYLDTEQHFSPGAARGDYPPISFYRERLEVAVRDLGEQAGEVNRVRREVQEACGRASRSEPGFFRLTVPTGGGKTLASLLFALAHAELFQMDRVIVAIPFTSIIDQTADVYRRIFGAENVLEHHSAVSPDDDEDQQLRNVRLRLAAENWDCPLVVTTNVRLFESLLANKPSKCRKLHNIARSVVVLDEAQSLPPRLIQATTDVLGWLVEHAASSVVFCTATQPDYSRIPEVPEPIVSAREIVPHPAQLFDRLRRVEFAFLGTLTHEDVAERLFGSRRALAILNTKKDAAKVFGLLAEDAFYLSTWLCPAHRRKVLAEVRRRLDAELPCRLISTQVVEAGVDVDFPFVLRAMAPLDSLVQAAGRCNRNGMLSQLGLCEVFELAEGGAPKGAYATAIGVTRRFLPSRIDEVGKPALQAEFTRAYFSATGTDVDVPSDGARTTLQALRADMNFPLVARHSALIDEETTSVIVRAYAAEEVDALLRSLTFGASPRAVARKLSNFSVALRSRELRQALRDGMASVHDSGLYLWDGGYDEKVGIGNASAIAVEELVV